eukprot:scaffold173640_cov37-Prasinocladus_malaysianus.AAC.1
MAFDLYVSALPDSLRRYPAIFAHSVENIETSLRSDCPVFLASYCQAGHIAATMARLLGRLVLSLPPTAARS